MNVEILVLTVKLAFWVTAIGCVAAVLFWPMPREKAPAATPAAPVRRSGYQVRGSARVVEPETEPIAVGYHPVLSARPRSGRRVR